MKPKQPERKDTKPNEVSGFVEVKSKFEQIGYVSFDGGVVTGLHMDSNGMKFIELEYKDIK